MSKVTFSLEEFLAEPNDFKIVNLLNQKLTDESCIKLADALKGNNTVNELYLCRNQIGDEGATAIVESLKGSNTLTFLNLNYNRISVPGRELLKSSWGNKWGLCVDHQMPSETLEEFLATPANFDNVSLSNKNLTDEDCVKLAEALKGNNTVKSLSLHSNQIGDQGLASLAEALKDNDTLKELYLSHNQIGDQGLAAFSEALKINKTISYICLDDNRIGDQGLAAFSEALKINKIVTHIFLHHNQIRGQRLDVLAEALKINQTVNYIDLSNNQIGDQGITSLGEALKVNKTITNIELHHNQISDQGVALLKASWQGCIKKLHFYGRNSVGEKAKSREDEEKSETKADISVNTLDTTWYDFLSIKDGLIKKSIPGDNILKPAQSEAELEVILNQINMPDYAYIIPLNVNAIDGSFSATNHWVGFYICTGADTKITTVKYLNPIGQKINPQLLEFICQRTGVMPDDLTEGKGVQFAYFKDAETLELKGNCNDCGPMLVQLFYELSTSGKILTCSLNEQESINFGQRCRKEQRYDEDHASQKDVALIDDTVNKHVDVAIEQNTVTIPVALGGVSDVLNTDDA
jgi:Ran GTPase-activating protein (RanGAP) involved in mRNA processing and transport